MYGKMLGTQPTVVDGTGGVPVVFAFGRRVTDGGNLSFAVVYCVTADESSLRLCAPSGRGALARAAFRVGMSKPASIPIIGMTTSNSTSVKPPRLRRTIANLPSE